MFSNLK
jgi:hypothetical protein